MANLLPHQEKCRNFIISHPKCGVFLDIGYGKTLTTLDAIDKLHLRNVLIIAPKAIARTTWHAEVAKWGYSFRCISMIEGTKTDKKGNKKKYIKKLDELYDLYAFALEATKYKGDTILYITTIDRVYHLAEWCENIGKCPFDMIVCDEFQTFGNGQSKRTKSLKKMADTVPRFVGLTGTPMPNSIEQLWSEIRVLDGGKRLGKWITQFREEYEYSTMVVNGYNVGWTPKRDAEKRIFEKIKDITISVKTDLHLPQCQIHDTPILMSDAATDIYTTFLKDGTLDLTAIDPNVALRHIDTQLTPANAAVLTGKLLQLASGTIYDENHKYIELHRQKVIITQYIIDNTPSPVLIAYNYVADEERLLSLLKVAPGEQVVKFDGSQEMQDAWNRGEYRVMLIMPASACYGINLQQGGHTLIWFSLPWNLQYYLQTNGRIYRQGQTQNVLIHRLITSGTIEERVAVALSNKTLNNDMLLDAVRREIAGVS